MPDPKAMDSWLDELDAMGDNVASAQFDFPPSLTGSEKTVCEESESRDLMLYISGVEDDATHEIMTATEKVRIARSREAFFKIHLTTDFLRETFTRVPAGV